MRIVFIDKKEETLYRVDNVETLENEQETVYGRKYNIWKMFTKDGTEITLQQKYYPIYRIEEE